MKKKITGKNLLIRVDNGGWAVYKTRGWSERNYKSDRQKGMRKILGKK